MTTEEKKAALIEAGVKVRSNASDETIDELWGEHCASFTGPETVADYEPVEDVVSVEVESVEAPDLRGMGVTFVAGADAPKHWPASDIMAEFKRIRETLGTNQLGPRTTAVFEWADKNLPADEWNKIYAGKRYNGEILQPKA